MTFTKKPQYVEHADVSAAMGELIKVSEQHGKTPILVVYARLTGNELELELSITKLCPPGHEHTMLSDVREIIGIRLKELQQ